MVANSSHLVPLGVGWCFGGGGVPWPTHPDPFVCARARQNASQHPLSWARDRCSSLHALLFTTVARPGQVCGPRGATSGKLGTSAAFHTDWGFAIPSEVRARSTRIAGAAGGSKASKAAGRDTDTALLLTRSMSCRGRMYISLCIHSIATRARGVAMTTTTLAVEVFTNVTIYVS